MMIKVARNPLLIFDIVYKNIELYFFYYYLGSEFVLVFIK